MQRSINEQINDELKNIEEQEAIKILYACESGSRAWGFPSADSDYDVRFIYIRPVNFYLSVDVENRRDVIERPIADDLDINGWDLRKALQLFYKSNPPLLEWLNSPIVYGDNYNFAEKMRALLPEVFSPTHCAYHYLQMARKNSKAYLQGETVRAKKYFYALRPLLAVQWIEDGRGVVPTEFGKMLDAIADQTLRATIDELMEQKKLGAELDAGPPIPILSEYIETELARRESVQFHFDETKTSIEPLNVFFREMLDTVWSHT